MSRRAWVAVGAVAAFVLAAAAAGLWLWRSRAPGPMIEITAPTAPIRVGDKVIAQAAKGERFPILGARDQWFQVKARIEGQEQVGWVHASHVRRIDPPRKGRGPIEAAIVGTYFPDAVGGEFPPRGRRWMLFEVQVRALEADAQGSCPVHTDCFAFRLQHLRYASPRYLKVPGADDKGVERVLAQDVERLAVGEMKLLRLVILVPSELVIHRGWAVEYTPPEPDAAIRLGKPKPSTAAPPAK